MQTAITLRCNGLTLRGMEHIPDGAKHPAPAAILFHGFTGTKLEPHRMFLKISRALLQRGIASFRYDFSGSGESDGDFEQMTLSGEVAEAHAILDSVRRDPRIDATRISLIGLSMGGLVASLVAGDRPGEIHRLVLMAPAGNMKEIALQKAAAAGADIRAEYFDAGGDLVGRAFAEDLMTLNAYERAKPYQGDVLLLHGTRDQSVAFSTSEQYRTLSYGNRAMLRPIEGADHTFNKMEWEQEVISSIVGFLAR